MTNIVSCMISFQVPFTHKSTSIRSYVSKLPYMIGHIGEVVKKKKIIGIFTCNCLIAIEQESNMEQFGVFCI